MYLDALWAVIRRFDDVDPVQLSTCPAGAFGTNDSARLSAKAARRLCDEKIIRWTPAKPLRLAVAHRSPSSYRFNLPNALVFLVRKSSGNRYGIVERESLHASTRH
jgi:hypothetical protein